MSGGNLTLHWLDIEARVGSPAFSRETRNTLTAVKTAALLLHQRWDDLQEEQRRELAHALARRIVELEQITLALDASARRAATRTAETRGAT